MKAFDETWEEMHKNNEWGKYPAEHVIRFIARNYYNSEDRNAIKILDFGCGGGAHTWFLAREGFHTYAFDGSKSAVEKLKIRLENEQLTADLKVMDGIELDYQDNYFDCVVDNVSVYCSTVDNISNMYQGIYRVLKKGGFLFTTAFTTNTTGYGTGNKIEYNTFKNITKGNLSGRGVAHFYGNGELEEILMNVGFKLKQVEFMEYNDRDSIVSMILIQAKKE